MHQDETGEMRGSDVKINVLGMKPVQYVGGGGLLEGLERGWKREKSEKVGKCDKAKGGSIEIRNWRIEEGGINENKMGEKRQRCAF